MSFASDIKAWQEKALLAANQSLCDVVDLLTTENINLTGDINYGKFSKGHIANNWRVSVDTPDLSYDSSADRSGSASRARLKVFLDTKPFYNKDAIVYVSNGIPYSHRADKVGWLKGQGTNGWVWSGRVLAYGFTGKAINNTKGRYM